MKKKNNNIGKKALIVGVSTMMAGGTVLPVQAMEKGASDTEIHTTVVDKSHLQELYDQYTGFTSESSWFKNFTKAYEKAGEILAKEDATEEEVTDAANELDQYYWLCKQGEKIKLYKFDSDGHSNFDYASYTTESIVPVYKVFRESNNYGTFTDTELVKKAYNDFVEAEKGLVKTDGTNVMRGLTEEGVHTKNKGSFVVQQTEVFKDEENNTKVKLHVEYHNTGIEPITGKDSGKFSSHDMNEFADGLEYDYETYAGKGGIKSVADEDIKPLEGEQYFSEGFQCDVIVDPGTYQFKTGLSGDPSALGVFYTDTGEEQGVDKTKLQEVYDKYKDYESPYDNNWTAGSFETYVKKAEEVLQNANATKEEVDEAAYDLEQKWLACNIEDYRLKYSVYENNINRDDYTTESLIPVYKEIIPIRSVDTNAPIEELRAIYEPIAEAEKGLVKTDEHGVMRGIQKEIASESMSKVGELVVTEDENTPAKFHIEFHNTGIHPITGAEKKKFTETEMKNPGLSVKIKGYDGKNMSTGISSKNLKPLDGETDFTKGFQVDYQGDIAGIYSFYIKPGYSNIPATGNYYSKDSSDIHVSDKDSLEDALDKVEENGTIYLDSDINWDKTEMVINKNITIDAQGHKIVRPADQNQATKSMLSINSKVNLKNVALQADGISESVLEVNKNGQVVLGENVALSGKIMNAKALVMVNGGTLQIDGATLSNSNGLGIILNNHASAIMNSGTISDLNVSGVSVKDGSTFTMNGGKIVNNNQAAITHTAGDGSKVYVKGGEISGNRKALDVNGIADDKSNLELSKGVLKGTNNITLRTSELVLPEDYNDIKIGRADEDKVPEYIKYIEESVDHNVKFPSTADLVSYWLTPSTNQIDLLLKQNSEFKDAIAFFVPVTENGDLDKSVEINKIDNLEEKDDYLTIKTDELKSDQAYVLLVANKETDKSNLQNLVDQVKDYYRYTTVYLEEFKPALDKAQDILAKEDATQEEVDAAYAALDKAYARCQIQDYILDYYYEADKKYADYTTDSAVAMYSKVVEAQDIFEENKQSTEELKAFIKELDAKKDGLVKLEEGAVKVEKGINEKAIDKETNKGYFTTTETSKGDKIILHVEYHNDGINHLTNKETGKLDFSDPESFKAVVNNKYYDKEEGTVSEASKHVKGTEVKPLDGENDLSKGFQFDFETDPGEVTYHIFQSGVQTYSLGTYYTDVDKNAPEVVSIHEMEDGRIHVEFSEPVTIEDSNWEKSDLEDEEDSRFWIGTLTEDKVYEVKVKDFPGNETTFTVDHKSPIVSSVSYSTTEPTNDKVKVKVNFDEYVSVSDTEQNPGWKYNVEHTIATKEYTENTDETVTFEDQTGNEVTVPIHIGNIDKTAPTVTVKDSSVGEKNHYGKLDLKLYDASGIDYVVVNGEKRDLSNNAWSDLNDDSVNYKEGENTVEVYDVAGNKTVYTFDYDKTGPTITVKDSSVGEKNHYGKLDLKLYDASGIDYVVVNGEKRDLSNNVWSDLNDDSVNYKEGENTVEVYDVCGNKTVFTFDYDKTGPAVTVKDSSTGSEGNYSKLDLKLHDASGIDYVIVNGEKRDLSNNTWSDLNNDSVNYKEGENTVEVYDVCGNKTVFTFVYDTTAPVIYAENKTIPQRSDFDPMDGVNATDQGKDITDVIVVEKNEVNTKRRGTYEVTYSVQDKAGNASEKTIQVTVERESLWDQFVDGVKDIANKVADGIKDFIDWLF